MTEKEKKLIAETDKAMKQVKKGHPLKDFLDMEDIENALNLLVKIGK